MGKQNENQAEKIRMYKKAIMKPALPDREFVNKGDPSHGVESGEDRSHAGTVRKVESNGYAYKGYPSEAWKY